MVQSFKRVRSHSIRCRHQALTSVSTGTHSCTSNNNNNNNKILTFVLDWNSSCDRQGFLWLLCNISYALCYTDAIRCVCVFLAFVFAQSVSVSHIYAHSSQIITHALTNCLKCVCTKREHIQQATKTGHRHEARSFLHHDRRCQRWYYGSFCMSNRTILSGRFSHR